MLMVASPAGAVRGPVPAMGAGAGGRALIFLGIQGRSAIADVVASGVAPLVVGLLQRPLMAFAGTVWRLRYFLLEPLLPNYMSGRNVRLRLGWGRHHYVKCDGLVGRHRRQRESLHRLVLRQHSVGRREGPCVGRRPALVPLLRYLLGQNRLPHLALPTGLCDVGMEGVLAS